MAASQKKRIGDRIREAREAMRGDSGRVLTQREFARLLPGKVDGPSVSRWERGIVKPGDEYLEAIANVTGRDVSFFLVEEPQTESPAVASSLQDMLVQMEERFTGRFDELATALAELRRQLPPEEKPPRPDIAPETDSRATESRPRNPRRRRAA